MNVICPKADECNGKWCGNYHKTFHSKVPQCDIEITVQSCPICIEYTEPCDTCLTNKCRVCVHGKGYKQERIRCDSVTCKDWNNNYCWSGNGCHLEQSAVEPRLYILPKKEALEQLVLEIRQHLLNTEFAPEPFTLPLELDFKTIYADKIIESAKEVDIDKLAEHIDNELYNNHYKRTKMLLKQAIEEFIRE